MIESSTSPRSVRLADGTVRLHHVAGLDGLRAIAVLAVVLHHVGFPGFRLGSLGVDLFFVLSGFLITTLLCREHAATNTVNLPAFWVRRALRLMPAYWLYCAGVTVAVLLGGTADFRSRTPWTPSLYIASLWGYFINYVPYGLWPHQHLTSHLWSLAVEEQFYFLWPVVLVAAFRLGCAVPVAWCAVAAIFGYSLLVPSGEIPFRLYTRGVPILTGCALALSCTGRVRDWLATSTGARRLLIGVIMISIVMVVVGSVLRSYTSEMPRQPYWIRLFVPALSLLWGVLICCFWYGRPSPLSRLLSLPPLVYVGRISYGLYLYHMFAFWIVDSLAISPWSGGLLAKFRWQVSVKLILTMAIAAASFHLFEQYFLRLKDRFGRKTKPTAVSVTAADRDISCLVRGDGG